MIRAGNTKAFPILTDMIHGPCLLMKGEVHPVLLSQIILVPDLTTGWHRLVSVEPGLCIGSCHERGGADLSALRHARLRPPQTYCRVR